MKRFIPIAIGVLIVGAAAWYFLAGRGPQPGTVQDEAMLAHRPASSFPAADEDYFKDMDNGTPLTPEEIKGRNMWNVWTGGNDRFWDVLIKSSFGTFDLLKTISSAPGLPANRDNRWHYLGLVNEPCFEKPSGPDPDRFGLWLDKRKADCPADPFANAQKYPGVKLGARGSEGLPVGSYYGEPTGIVGLRLFPNPDFDEAARKRWDPVRYYNDPSYYQQKDLVRPYRVGMSCGFCHVGPSPIHPPADPENPQWSELNSTVGAQYFWFDRVFVWSADKANYIFQLLHTYRPGALDTSLVSTDAILNPRTMNAIYQLGPRVMQAKPFGRELLTGGQLDNKQFNDFVSSGPLTTLYDKPYVYTPRVLKDGSDSVGALGALNRVYLNIGLFSEEWLLHFNAFAGGKRITPIRIADAERNSAYWQATEQQTPSMAAFLVAAGRPDRLADLPPPTRDLYLTKDEATLERGKTVFAERCARCHSGKLPHPVAGMEGPGTETCNGPSYLQCWNTYWAWTKTDDFKQKMLAIVKAPDFLQDNYLSSEFRVPVTLLQTNACSPLARNALAGNIWDNFSSQSYKDLPSVGDIKVRDPFTGEEKSFSMPAGGRGYTRPPSLVSLWSTAPFLLNNTLGPFDPEPSVSARMHVFQASIEQLLWPEKRPLDPVLGAKGVGLIDRTTARSWVIVPAGFLPGVVKTLRQPINWFLPNAVTPEGDLKIGPIPKGTPVGLIANFDFLPEQDSLAADIGQAWKLLRLGLRLRHDMAAMPADATDTQAAEIFTPLGRELYSMSTCPDYVQNRGHYFGTDQFTEEPALTDSQKRDLIEYLKTF
ncbi:hypothetical protein [Rhodopila sp.]|jgi:hypothetical protein|uniref:hypothetical protein n=1 Tax=Rhodopila sp. TaxID=2480087 RepID=UPI002BB93AEE|nr:hypothetical protein [Rhodopila sp.]HVZ10392.1 hypothetical protein [Rhodopila sp.]